jgi:hypothetical protein
MATGIQIVFDCAEVDRMAKFWAEALGYKLQDPPDGFASWEDWLRDAGIPESEWDRASAIVDPEGARPRIYFQKVPEPKVAKNRVHIDVNCGGPAGTPLKERRPRVEAEAERLKGLGASELRRQSEHGEFWIVMQDVEGNEFCLQ